MISSVQQLLSAVTSKRRRNRRLRALSVEPLEYRVLPTVVWATKGSASLDHDGFNAAFGTNAARARGIVDHAIADWNATIQSPVTLRLRLYANNIAAIGETSIETATSLGVPTQALINLDINANGIGWYFDPDIRTDAEFTPVNGFYGVGVMSGVDLYTVVAHEIGHALGYVASSQLAIGQYLTPTGPGKVVLDNPNDTRGPIQLNTIGGLHSEYSYDLMAVGSSAPHRRLISEETVEVLKVAYGYAATPPLSRDSLYVDTAYDSMGNATTTVRTIRSTSIRIQSDQQRINVWADIMGPWGPSAPEPGESVPANARINVIGTSGDDELRVSRQTLSGGQSITFSGGSGADRAQYYMLNGEAPLTINNAVLARQATSSQTAFTLQLNSEELYVIGSSGPDVIRVYNNSFRFVAVEGNAGNDFIDGWNNGLTQTAVLYVNGDDGDDTLLGTPNADILIGDDGNDTIWGGGGRDILVGGRGADEIVANFSAADEDIIIAGVYTSSSVGIGYEYKFAQAWQASLRSISAEWNSVRTRSQRIANLRGTGSGTRLNGTSYLNSSTVLDDGISDSIVITANIDWIVT